jgi:hypothetical protein
MTGEPISPELALIDPGLALSSRQSLPEPGCFQPGYATPTAATHPARTTLPLPGNTQRPGRSRLAIWGAVAIVAATTAVALLAIALTSPADIAPVLATPMHAETHPPPRPGARHDSTGTTWPAVPGTHGYSVALAQDGLVVYRATTLDTTLRLPADLHLTPGRYTWTVTPQPDHPTSGQPSRPLVETTFTVPVE